MRIAYLDCFAGISGDMFLGATVDAGVPAEVLQEAVKALDIGASLKIERVDRSGISCTKVYVLEGGFPVGEASDVAGRSSSQGAGDHNSAAEPIRMEQQDAADKMAHTHQPKTQHQHKTGHAHTYEEDRVHNGHTHGRSLTQIRSLIQKAPLHEAVKKTAVHIFELLGMSEAKIHNVPVDEIHFHEVGAVDAIADIVAASTGIHHLQVDAWYCSALNVGGGVVECAHGTFPVPAPATADLLRGFPTYSAHLQKELISPTGAALLRALDPMFGPQPAMRVAQIGYGAGTRDPKGFPNVLRIHIGESQEAASSEPKQMLAAGSEASRRGEREVETVVVLETALDDLSPQVIAYVAETALAEGALDVMLTPVVMKKGRPGTLLTILCDPSKEQEMERLILRETSTLGVRVRYDRRTVVARRHVTVATAYGEIRMKVGSLTGEELNAAPEFEDCRTAAVRHRVALKLVQQAAASAYRAANKEREDAAAGSLPGMTTR